MGTRAGAGAASIASMSSDVPEPGTALLLAIGLSGLCVHRRLVSS